MMLERSVFSVLIMSFVSRLYCVSLLEGPFISEVPLYICLCVCAISWCIYRSLLIWSGVIALLAQATTYLWVQSLSRTK